MVSSHPTTTGYLTGKLVSDSYDSPSLENLPHRRSQSAFCACKLFEYIFKGSLPDLHQWGAWAACGSQAALWLFPLYAFMACCFIKHNVKFIFHAWDSKTL